MNKKRISYIKVKTPVSDVLCGYIICSLAYLLFSSCMPEKQAYAPKKYRGLKGKITSICDSVYDCTLQDFIPATGKLIEVSIMEFDAEGNTIKTMGYNADSTVMSISEFVYKDHVLFSTKSRQHIGEDVFTVTSERIAASNGTLRYKESNGSQEWIKEVTTTGNYHLEYSEGDYGYTKEELWADDDSNIVKTKYILMDKEHEFVNGTHTIEKTTTMKYGEDGNVTEIVFVEGKDTMVTVCSHPRYDKYGNWTEERKETNGYFKQLIKRTINYAGH